MSEVGKQVIDGLSQFRDSLASQDHSDRIAQHIKARRDAAIERFWSELTDPLMQQIVQLQSENADLRKRLEEAERLAHGWPITSDGVRVAMGDIVWHPDHGDLRVYWDELPRCGGVMGWVAVERYDLEEERPEITVRIDLCYSTRETALASISKEKG